MSRTVPDRTPEEQAQDLVHALEIIRTSGSSLLADVLEQLAAENEALRHAVRGLTTRLDGVVEHLAATTEELDARKAGQRLHPVVAQALSPFAPAA